MTMYDLGQDEKIKFTTLFYSGITIHCLFSNLTQGKLLNVYNVQDHWLKAENCSKKATVVYVS